MKELIKKVFVLGIIGSVVGAITVIATVVYFSMNLPSVSTLAEYKPPIPSRIYSKDGVVLAEIGREHRDVAKIEEIPSSIIEAFLAAEDDNFYNHSGVDYMGVVRAFVANIKAGRVVQGGSTITQQVAKSLLLTSERSITRKIKDFLLAQKIEEKFSKEQILFLYLNQVYLGGGYYGVKSAFRGYFGKELEEASVAEAAMVAGLLVAPSKYSPYKHPRFAKTRQKYVLSRMYATKKITKEQYQQALEEQIKYRLRKPNPFKAGYFTDWVRQRVIEVVGEKRFLNDGFEVTTTLDYELQKQAEKNVSEGVKAIDKRQGYKGPIKTIELDKIKEYEKAQREKIYKNESNYFVLDDEFKKNYELVVTDEEMEKLYEKRNFFINENKIKFYGGNLAEDKVLQVLAEEKSYEAIVIKADDRAKVIYVSIAGVVGAIPYKYYRWVHERNISSDRVNWSYSKYPTKIVKPGEVILVKVIKKNGRYKDFLAKDYFSQVKEISHYSELKKERFLICEFDQKAEAQGALVSIDPFTGEIVSFVGGSDFLKSQFNRAVQSLRQPGSAFKPILYAAALENGFTPSSVIIDSPEALGGVDESLSWKPRNYDGKFKGPMTFRESLEISRNIPTIKIAHSLGVKKITDFVKRIGFNVELEKDLSLALGSFGVNLLDIVSTYAIFPNGGKFIYPFSITSIQDRDGNQYTVNEIKESPLKVIEEEKEEPTPEASPTNSVEGTVGEVEEVEKKKENPFHLSLGGNQVYDPRLSYIMTNLLKGVVLHGSGRKAKAVSHFLGGKTGTTSSYVDAWFLGFSSKLVTGVWTGFDDNKTLGFAESGSRAALPIWRDFMKAAKDKFGEHDFKIPSGIINVKINKKTGRLSKSRDTNTFIESFVEGTEPGRKNLQIIDETDGTDTSTDILEDDDYYNNQ